MQYEHVAVEYDQDKDAVHKDYWMLVESLKNRNEDMIGQYSRIQQLTEALRIANTELEWSREDGEAIMSERESCCCTEALRMSSGQQSSV